MKKVKYRKSFATNIIAIFLIFNIFSIMFFSYYVKIKEDNKNVQYAKSSLQEIVDEKSELISISFNRIETPVSYTHLSPSATLIGAFFLDQLRTAVSLRLYSRATSLTDCPDNTSSAIIVLNSSV